MIRLGFYCISHCTSLSNLSTKIVSGCVYHMSPLNSLPFILAISNFVLLFVSALNTHLSVSPSDFCVDAFAKSEFDYITEVGVRIYNVRSTIS